MQMKCNFCNKTYKVKENTCPFVCVYCGAVSFPIKALHDYVIIYPIRKPPVKTKLVVLPDVVEPEYTDFGIVLSVGEGYYDSKKFNATDPKLKPGLKVIYDKTVLWDFIVKMPWGESLVLKIMPHKDIKSIVK